MPNDRWPEGRPRERANQKQREELQEQVAGGGAIAAQAAEQLRALERSDVERMLDRTVLNRTGGGDRPISRDEQIQELRQWQSDLQRSRQLWSIQFNPDRAQRREWTPAERVEQREIHGRLSGREGLTGGFSGFSDTSERASAVGAVLARLLQGAPPRQPPPLPRAHTETFEASYSRVAKASAGQAPPLERVAGAAERSAANGEQTAASANEMSRVLSRIYNALSNMAAHGGRGQRAGSLDEWLRFFTE